MKKFLSFFVFVMLGSIQFAAGQNGSSQFSMPSARPGVAGQSTPAHPSTSLPKPKSHSTRVRPNGSPSNPPVNPASFVSVTQIPAGGITGWSAVSADFNNDGKLDVAAPIQTGTSTYAVSLVLGNGDGTFQPASVIANPNGANGDQIVVGDFNKDGKQDLVVVHATSPATYEVWLGNGDGTFNVQSNTTQPITANFVAGGTSWDVNNDGNLDLVFVDVQTPAADVYTLIGNGDGTFQLPTSVTVSNPSSGLSNFVFADFNGDGILDFVASEAVSVSHPQNIVYLGQSGGTFQAGTALLNPTLSYDVCNNSAGDLNGDGKLDIVSASNCTAGGAAGSIVVYLNNGNGTFKSGVYYDAATETVDSTVANIAPLAVTIADVNGDGINDVVSSNASGGDITILLGKGDGTLTVPTVGYATGGTPKTSALVADFNGDGVADIVVPDDAFSFDYLEGYGDGTFRAPLDFYSPVPGGFVAGATTIATGDLNGDGFPDFVVGNVGFNHSGGTSGIGTTVFLSNADGSLNPGVNYGTGGSYQGVAIADFDGDGNLDFAAVNQSNNNVVVYHGAGDGTFGTASSYPTSGTSGITMISGDFNKDGHPDLAIANTTSNNISVMLNDGSGHFPTAANYPTGGPNQYITAADVNNDGILDLIVTQFNPGVVAVLLGNADGTFQATSTPAFAFNYLGSVAVADLDGDGKLDLAVVVDDGLTPNEGIAVAKGNGDGTFGTAVLYSTTLQNVSLTQPFPGDVKIVDLNGDGKLDLVYSNTFYGTVGVLYNTGANAFASGMFYDPVEVGAGSNVFALALTDINQDGALDVIAADNSYAGMTILLNAGGSTNKVVSSLNPATFGQSVTFTATIAATVRGAAAPTGSVTFMDGSTSLGNKPLSGGIATLASTSLSVGTHSITAVYSGDSNFKTSTSSATSEVINAIPDFTLGATSATATVTAGASATYTLSVTPAGGYSGTVSFTCPATLPTKVTCSFSPTSAAPASGVYPTTTLTLATTAAVASSTVPARPNSNPVAPTLWASLTGFGLFGVVLIGAGSKRRRNGVIFGLLLLTMAFTMFGCGGSSSSNNNNGGGTPGTPTGSYTVTVTAAGSGSGAPTHTMDVTLVVQ